MRGACGWFKIAVSRSSTGLVRFLLCVILGVHSALAGAALSCEQLANTAAYAQQMRDKGYSLAEVKAEADKLDASDKLTPEEVSRVKSVVEQGFNGSLRTPLDILQECRDKQPR